MLCRVVVDSIPCPHTCLQTYTGGTDTPLTIPPPPPHQLYQNPNYNNTTQPIKTQEIEVLLTEAKRDYTLLRYRLHASATPGSLGAMLNVGGEHEKSKALFCYMYREMLYVYRNVSLLYVYVHTRGVFPLSLQRAKLFLSFFVKNYIYISICLLCCICP